MGEIAEYTKRIILEDILKEKNTEIERLKKEKDDLVLANKGRKALIGAQFKCMEKLEKEKEWLLNIYVKDRFDKEKTGAREYVIRQMQQALKDKP